MARKAEKRILLHKGHKKHQLSQYHPFWNSFHPMDNIAFLKIKLKLNEAHYKVFLFLCSCQKRGFYLTVHL